MRWKRLIWIARVDRVEIYFHWSTLAIAGALLLYGIQHFLDALALIAGYWGVLLIHEWGHVLAARRRRCAAYDIEVYPIHGLTRISMPASPFDGSVIAWGGVLAQIAVSVPVFAWVRAIGFVPSGPQNALLLMLGPFNLLIAVLNLFPVGNLDGAKAWPLIPILLRRLVGRARRLGHDRRSPPGRKRKKDWVH